MTIPRFLLFFALFPGMIIAKMDVSGIADTLQKQSKNKELGSIHDKIMKKPDSLIKGDEAKEGLEALKALKAKDVTFERLQGFDGIEEYEPSGWRIEATPDKKENEPEGENELASTWPMGVGVAMMSGCFGNNYQIGDPCYDFARNSPICLNQIDAANFLGVGFDGRGFYSSESRKKSIIQRTCAGKATFMDKDVPDCMNAFGIYDYTIHTETFQNAEKYVHYLQEKAATSEQQTMFHMEAESFGQGKSIGGNLGMIGGLVGMAAGAVAGKKSGGAQAGADAGAKLGAAIGQSIGGGYGEGKGGSRGRSNGRRKANVASLNAESKTVGSATHMIAVLEADLKLFEIVLDEIKPTDLSASFLNDFLRLPHSYWSVNGDIKFQNFILRWGTHYVKSAKFGGELRILKTSKRTSKLNTDQFASQSQSEFASMMGVLRSSYQQKEYKVGFLGLGAKYSKGSQQAQATQKQEVGLNKNQKNQGVQRGRQSEFIKTKIEAKGGDPEIAAAITDFYTPRFRELFIKWLDSIDEFQRPFEFTLGKISSILNMNTDSLFPTEIPQTACFQKKNLKRDKKSGLSYFEFNKVERDNKNKTFVVKRKNICKFGHSKEVFMEALMRKRLALERAENIYMAEGPFSTTSFDIPGGEAGCESETIEYEEAGHQTVKYWPSWKELGSNVYKVVFYMRYNLPGILKNSEFLIKFAHNLWYTKRLQGKFSIENSCPSSTEKFRICVAQLPMIYDETTGLLYLDIDKTDYELSWLKYPLASVREVDPISLLQRSVGAVGFVPCSIKWSNTHKVRVTEKGSCIYFHAASSGSIYLVFSGVPEDYKKWFYLQMTPSGVVYYQAMKIAKSQHSEQAVTTGKETLFTGFFICIFASADGLRIDFGKAPEESEVGIVLTSHTYSDFIKYDVMYFTFGSGENKISINDVRVVKEKPKLSCGKDLTLINDVCKLQCHKQCIGCNKANDPKSCIKCVNKKVMLNQMSFICTEKCPSEFLEKENQCQCKIGGVVEIDSKIQCKPCPKGSKAVNGICQGEHDCKIKNPCKNGGKCVETSSNGFLCECPKHYLGKLCEVPSKCAKNPCYNGGECKQTNNFWEFDCLCKADFTGGLCETAISSARFQPVKAKSVAKGSSPTTLVTGIQLQSFFSKTVDHPYIEVDLGRKLSIDYVDIYKRRKDKVWLNVFPFRLQLLADGKIVGDCSDTVIKREFFKELKDYVRVDCCNVGTKADAVRLTKWNRSSLILSGIEVLRRVEKCAKFSAISAKASSTLNQIKPQNLIDNGYFKSNRWNEATCFSTNTESDPWLDVLLKKVETIGHVRIWNRVDTFEFWGKLFPFRVEIWKGQFKVANCKAAKLTNGIFDFKAKMEVDCGLKGIAGDRVRIQKLGKGFLHICEVEIFPVDCLECYRGYGVDYRGRIQETKDGEKCLNWWRSYSSKYNPKKKPDAGLKDNYCRNPSKSKFGPWCYVEKPARYGGHGYGYCDIKKC